MHMFLSLSLLFLCNMVTAHRVCDIGRRAWLPFSGYRIQRNIQLSNSGATFHIMTITKCKNGKQVDSFSCRIPSHNDVLWNTTLCDGSHTCLRLVRRKKYVLRDLNFYLPYQLVGAIYFNTSDSYTVMPLMADNSIHSWIDANDKGLMLNVPLLRTPDVLDRRAIPEKDNEDDGDWTDFIDPYENYDQSDYRSPVSKRVDLLSEAISEALRGETGSYLFTKSLVGEYKQKLETALLVIQHLKQYWDAYVDYSQPAATGVRQW